MSSFRLSETLVNHDHIGRKSSKLIAQTISPTSSLFVAQRSSTQRNMEKFWGENVRSTPTSIMSSWTESTDSHVILGEGVAVLFTFVGTLRGYLCDNTAFLLILTSGQSGAQAWATDRTDVKINKTAVLSQRWPCNAPYIWVPWVFECA